MDMRLKFIERLASKLGVRNNSVIRKTDEYLRLLELKTASSNANALNMSETCRAVICIELATAHVGQLVEKDDVVKLSGVTRKLYVNFYHLVEKLLGLHQSYAIKDICLQLGMTEITNLAQEIMDTYMRQLHGHGADVAGHPMYPAAAIHTACKHSKLKVSRAQLLDLSHVKRQEFDRLIKDVEERVELLLKKKRAKLCSQEEQSDGAVGDHLKEVELADGAETPGSGQAESYEDWKQRILSQSAK